MSLATIERRLARLEQRAGLVGGWRGYPAPPVPSDADARTVLTYLIEAGCALRNDALGQQLRRLIEAAHANEQEAS